MAADLSVELAGGLALVTLDRACARLNTLDRDLLERFSDLLERLESESGIDLVVLRSGKPDNFIVGADLEELRQLDTEEQASELARRGQAIAQRWNCLPVPTVAAIHGATMGGGLEVALASTYRVATDDRQTVFAMPEVRLGLIPALGGTYRLPRQVGLEEALSLLLTARQVSARRALEIGLVDRLSATSELLATASDLGRSGGRDRATATGGNHGVGGRLRRHLVLGAARKRVKRQAGEHYPAPLAIVEAVATGLHRGEAAALEAEAQSFGRLAVSPVSAQLINLFRANRAACASDRRDGGPSETGRRALVGVVGAGFMGAGIAAASDLAGHAVSLTDIDPAAIARARGLLDQRLEARLARRWLDREEADQARARLTIGRQIEDLGDVDLVVEAVFEDLDLKLRVLTEVEKTLPRRALLASNTSTIPIARLAAGLRHPERFLGLHFFSPVHRMPLVEIIRQPESEPESVERAVEFVRGLGKTPIVVDDGPGFYTTRILSPYLAQGAAMLQERRPIAAIDAAARAAGFPVGPLELLDEVGIDVAAHAGAILAAAFPDRAMLAPELPRMVEAGRLGRKSGRGFYDYRGKRKRPDESLHRDVFGWPSVGSEVDGDHLERRLLLAMAAEAVRCLDDGILQQPRDGDLGAVLGLGFPPFLGGPFRYLDDLGAAVAIRRLDQLSETYGASFDCPDSLRRKAISGGRFYPGGS